MRKHRRSLLQECKGVAALEFALIGPVFLLLLLFAMQASFVLWTKSAIEAVASQTARCTALGAPACTNPTNPRAFATSLMDTWGVAGFVPSFTIFVESSVTCDNAAGRFSMVTISGAASSFAYFVPPLSTVVLTSKACYPSSV